MSSLNYMELCRLCLVKDRVQIPIFEGEGDIRQIFLKIAACLPVKVKKDDKLPKKICDECMYKVESLYQFWNTTANAEKQLLEWLGEAVEDKKTSSDAHVKQEGLEQDPCSELAKSLSRVEAVLAEAREAESDNDHFATGKAETDSDDEPLSSLEPTTFVNVGLDGSGTSESRTQGEFLAPGAPSTSKTSNSTNAQTTTSGCKELDNILLEIPWLDDSNTEKNAGKEVGEEDEKLSETPNDDKFKGIVEKCSVGQNFCIVCNTQYFNKTEFEVHARSHKKIPCMICRKVCLTGLRLLSHMRNMHSNRPKTLPCDQCSKMFATANSLWVHKKTIHRTKWELTCSQCGYGTNSKEMFEEHLQKAGENHSSFKCDACDKEYASQQNLDKHIQLYHVDHRCKYCNKEYGNRNNLLRHIQRSHGKQKFRDIPCEQCNKMFFTKWQLKVHMNLHINQKHQCPYCQYSTVYPQALKTHVKIHTKQYNCICDWCGKGFMNKCALKNHMAREHLGIIVSCPVCQKKFHAQRYLDLHMECHQPGYELRNHQCEICGRRFLRRPMLRRHLRAHKGLTKTYKCSYCNKILTSSSSLKDHINIHTGQRPYVCEICGNGFARKNYLTAHLRTHTKEKPFTCSECGCAFSQRGTLTMHLRKHRERSDV